jgi:DNA polymerase III alpha subunit (gram-positive type)
MIYVSVDIETTGLEPEKNKILSIGAIIEDTEKKLPYDELPKFYGIILQRELVGSPRAITINKNLISTIADYLESNKEDKLGFQTTASFYEEDEIVKEFFDFLFLNGFGYDTSGTTVRINDGRTLPIFGGQTKSITINVAGKNFGTFDKLFLQKLPWWNKLIKVRQRVLDPAILYVDWNNDNSLPSLNECKERAKIEGVVTHDALDDAWDVVKVLRKFY